MQATEMIGTTSALAPYDVIRPLRCGGWHNRRPCERRASDIDWNAPGMHTWRCERCGTPNVVRIVEAGQRGEG